MTTVKNLMPVSRQDEVEAPQKELKPWPLEERQMNTSRLALAAAPSIGGATFAAGTLTPEVCAGLAGWTIAESEITLPSSGGAVTDANWGTGPGADLFYCMVSGTTSPVGLEVPDITWQANLPQHWNANCCSTTGAATTGPFPTCSTLPRSDQARPPDLVRATADLIPKARFVCIAGPGHLPAIDAPEETARLIRTLVEEPHA